MTVIPPLVRHSSAVSVRAAYAFADWPPCTDCHHRSHDPARCGAIVGTFYGPAPEPDYCPCDTRTIEHFCSRCFGEVRSGEFRSVVGTGPDGEQAVLCESCHRHRERYCDREVERGHCRRSPNHPGKHSRVGCSEGC
jgi:hypothetical protein